MTSQYLLGVDMELFAWSIVTYIKLEDLFHGLFKSIAFGFAMKLPLWNRNAGPIATATAERAVAAERLRGALERALQDLDALTIRRDAALAQRERIETVLLPLVERQIADSQRFTEPGGLELWLDAVLRADDARTTALSAATAEAAATAALNQLFWPQLTTQTTKEIP